MSFILNPHESSGPRVEQFKTNSQSMRVLASICPYSFMVSKTFLKEYIPWLSKTFREIKIWSGEYLERHNIAVFERKNQIEAENKAIKKEEKTTRLIYSIIDDNSIKNITIINHHEVLASDKFIDINRKVKKYCKTNQALNNDITGQTILMTKTNQRALQSGMFLSEKNIKSLKEYLLEELSFYLTLYQEGYLTEIYPGRDLHYMKKIADGKFPDFPFDFSERTHLSVTRGVN